MIWVEGRRREEEGWKMEAKRELIGRGMRGGGKGND